MLPLSTFYSRENEIWLGHNTGKVVRIYEVAHLFWKPCWRTTMPSDVENEFKIIHICSLCSRHFPGRRICCCGDNRSTTDPKLWSNQSQQASDSHDNVRYTTGPSGGLFEHSASENRWDTKDHVENVFANKGTQLLQSELRYLSSKFPSLQDVAIDCMGFFFWYNFCL
jgi:hypothetical protein